MRFHKRCLQLRVPSGSLVDVIISASPKTSLSKYLDLYITPLREDAFHTSGLCGNYNGDVDDDRSTFSGAEIISTPACSRNCEQYRYNTWTVFSSIFMYV